MRISVFLCSFHCSTNIIKVTATEQGIDLVSHNSATGAEITQRYDAVILATGYERNQHLDLLAPLAEYIGEYNVDRNYRLQTDDRCKPAIYLQGSNESTHGLSDTLLSVLAVRSDEIAESLHAYLAQQTAPDSTSFSQSLLETG